MVFNFEVFPKVSFRFQIDLDGSQRSEIIDLAVFCDHRRPNIEYHMIFIFGLPYAIYNDLAFSFYLLLIFRKGSSSSPNEGLLSPKRSPYSTRREHGQKFIERGCRNMSFFHKKTEVQKIAKIVILSARMSL